MKQFNVLIWDFNSDSLVHYDVLVYLRRCYDNRVKRVKEYSGRGDSNIVADWFKVPETFDDFKKFVGDESRYQFWSRCEYEMICHGWPVRKNKYKLDVHEQIMMNIDIISEMLWKEVSGDSAGIATIANENTDESNNIDVV